MWTWHNAAVPREALNAVARCCSFSLQEMCGISGDAQLAALACDEYEVTDGNVYPFADDLLANYTVEVLPIHAPVERMAWTMCGLLLMQVRREIHARLERFLTRAPPMLDIELHVGPRRPLSDHEEECVPVVMERNVDGAGLLEISEWPSLGGVALREFKAALE